MHNQRNPPTKFITDDFDNIWLSWGTSYLLKEHELSGLFSLLSLIAFSRREKKFRRHILPGGMKEKFHHLTQLHFEGQ